MKKSGIAVVALVAAIGITPAVMFGNARAEETKKVESKESKAKEKSEHAAMQKEAKISMRKARGIALKKAPGKVKSSELEREDGKLIYSFDINNGTDITEVHVDAVTGDIVKVEHETPAKEAAEKKLDSKQKKH